MLVKTTIPPFLALYLQRPLSGAVVPEGHFLNLYLNPSAYTPMKEASDE